MYTYKEMFTYYEEEDMHEEIEEVEEASEELRKTLDGLKVLWGAAAVEKLDDIIGKVERAYEMQGFLFAQNVISAKQAYESEKYSKLFHNFSK